MARRIGLLLVIFWASNQVAPAQVTTGTISGVVRDATGAVIPGASIAARNVDTGIVRTVVTDEQGRYLAPNLSLGNYELSAQRDGFQTELRRGIVLTVGREAVVNFELQVGTVTQTVEVTGEAPLVETTGSSVGGLVETSQIVNLPLNGRSFDELALLQPAVTVSKFAGSGSIQSGYTTKMSIRGARPEQNSFLLDGTDVMGPTNQIPGSVGGQSFGVDAVREFRVETTTFSAQYGRAAGGVINVITKSGTNELHGTVFEFLRNDNLDAPKWEDNRAGAEKPEFKRNQFGFSLGGPILRDRTFFFGSYEARRDREGRTQSPLVPTAAARETAIPAVKPYLDAFYPLPNGRINPDGTGEYNYSAARTSNEDFFTVRADHSFSPSDSFFVRYTFDDGRRRNPNGVGIFWEVENSRNQYVTLEETHIFSPRLLNTARLGFNRSYTALEPLVIGVERSTLERLAFVPGQPLLLTGSSLSTEDIEGIGTANLPRIWSWNLFEGSEDVTYSTGLHSVKFGALFKTMLYVQRAANSQGGDYTFDSLNDFLQGRASIFRALQPGAVNTGGYPYYYFGWYVQDDIRLHPRLTLNLGLRHEFYTGPTERHGRVCNLDNLFDAQLRCGGQIFPTSATTKNFGPRFGFAWDVSGDGRTSVRGGFGRYFDAISPLWWQGPAGGSFPPFSDAEIANPSAPFPNAYQLLGSAGSQTSYLASAGITAAPSTIQYNLTVQRQVSRDSTVMLGYVGSQGRHLWTRANENIRQPTILPDGTKFFPAPPAGVRLGASVLRRNPLYADVRRVRTEANSSYNGLLAAFQKRFGAGLQFQTSYTFSKAMDTGSTITNNSNAGGSGGTGIMDPDDWKRDRSLSDFDTRHILSLNSVWELPFGPGKAWGSGLTGVAARILEGWQLGGVLKAASSSPITINSSSRNWSRNGVTSRLERPDLAPGASNNPTSGTSTGCTLPVFSSSSSETVTATPQTIAGGTPLGTPDLWYDPCAFRVQPFGFYGNLGRNTVSGPNQVTLDFSLSKNTAIPRISEQFRVQFRAEFFNILNHPNFGLPGLRVFSNRGQVSSSSVGVITSTTTSARQIQFGLKLFW